MPQKLNKSNAKEIGHITAFFEGVVKIEGLPHAAFHEVLIDQQGNESALVIGFDENTIEALIFDKYFDSKKPLFRSKRIFSLPISSSYLGRVVNGFGKPIDGIGQISGTLTPVFQEAPPIISRQPVNQPLSTGIKIIDATLPLGRGQRELIIGDRKLGKSTLAIDVVLNQKYAKPPVYCVYVLCGQTQRHLKELVFLFKKKGAFSYSAIVAATASDSFAAQYLAPFVGCAIGEHFRNQGKNALIVYDDLSKHAKVYRNIALLLERAPGREAYPGDIFSLHAQLLERAAKLNKSHGGGSLTALPIIETQEGDITAFIPTNIISITDGQIYLERGLYQKRFLPAVNIGLSVSRVGSEAQPALLKEVTKGIRLNLAQYKDLQKLAQLETNISQEAQAKVKRGQLNLEILKQDKHINISWPEEVILFYGLEQGAFDDVPVKSWHQFEPALLRAFKAEQADLLQDIRQGRWNKKTQKQIISFIGQIKKDFGVSQPALQKP